jgi:hypothetical protein
MPKERFDWHERIKAIEREFDAARIAVSRLLEEAGKDTTILHRKISVSMIRQTLDHLEPTYLIRIFAEFESGLRVYWRHARKRHPPARTHDLLEGLAAYRKIPDGTLVEVHAAREYRNALVHERDDVIREVSLRHACRHLSVFLSMLPEDWT